MICISNVYTWIKINNKTWLIFDFQKCIVCYVYLNTDLTVAVIVLFELQVLSWLAGQIHPLSFEPFYRGLLQQRFTTHPSNNGNVLTYMGGTNWGNVFISHALSVSCWLEAVSLTYSHLPTLGLLCEETCKVLPCVRMMTLRQSLKTNRKLRFVIRSFEMCN